MYLKQGQVSDEHIVVGDPAIDPIRVPMHLLLLQTHCFVGYHLVTEFTPGVQLHALEEPAHEGVDADDGENQPENQTHQ